MALSEPTYIGQVASVSGSIVRVRLREDMSSTLVLIGGESHRVGQIGGFLRIPLGYTNLYGVCTQVGADAAPPGVIESGSLNILESDMEERLSGYRWLTIALFGESLGGQFERGVGQYPTVGDEVHLATLADLRTVYGWTRSTKGTVSVGSIAYATGISADIDIAGLVSRHSAVIGSTGSGKSNLVTVLLESISDGVFQNARSIVIDPHGEYATALGNRAQVFRVDPKVEKEEKQLLVPYWALPMSELLELTMGGLQPNHEAAIREMVLDMKVEAAGKLRTPPPVEALTADSPVPFSIKKLWYELDRFERMTFKSTKQDTPQDALEPEESGNAGQLRPARYPTASPYNQPPYKNQRKRYIERQLALMQSRLRDARFSFLFSPSDGYGPDETGGVTKDLDTLVSEWVGHDRPVTVFDVSGLPSDVLSVVVGTMLRIVYDILFWAQALPVGGRQQPLLVVLDEAHRFAAEGATTSAHRTLEMIAKEGRKYGVGLMLVTQRPSEIDAGVLSQCGSLISLRLTNQADRSRVAAAVPDDLGGLVEQLPALRTGEGIFVGEVMAIPSRVRVRKARNKPVGDDPELPGAWLTPRRAEARPYTQALRNWRMQSIVAAATDDAEGEKTDA